MVVEWIKEAGGILAVIVSINEGLQVFLFQEREIAGDDEPVGVRVMLEGSLETAERAGTWLKVGKELNVQR